MQQICLVNTKYLPSTSGIGKPMSNLVKGFFAVSFSLLSGISLWSLGLLLLLFSQVLVIVVAVFLWTLERFLLELLYLLDRFEIEPEAVLLPTVTPTLPFLVEFFRFIKKVFFNWLLKDLSLMIGSGSTSLFSFCIINLEFLWEKRLFCVRFFLNRYYTFLSNHNNHKSSCGLCC